MLLEQVYELLKEQIIDRVYGPGDKLNIDAIAREMKVSSTLVREALARLVARGSLRLCHVGFAIWFPGRRVEAAPGSLCKLHPGSLQLFRGKFPPLLGTLPNAVLGALSRETVPSPAASLSSRLHHPKAGRAQDHVIHVSATMAERFKRPDARSRNNPLWFNAVGPHSPGWWPPVPTRPRARRGQFHAERPLPVERRPGR